MSRDKAGFRVRPTFAGALIGAFVGFAPGAYGWLAFFYVLFMLPKRIPFRVIDQGAIPVIVTASLGPWSVLF